LAKNRQEFKLGRTDILGKKVLILGESGSGKTKLAAKLVEELMAIERIDRITIIDFAPKRTNRTGGKLTDYLSITGGVKYLTPKEVQTPRLTGTSKEQILQLARLNRKLMDPFLSHFIKNATEVLIMNDITLYLHSGRLERILECTRLAKTFLGTAYYGSKLANDMGTEISQREKRLTDELAASMDRVVRIS
jgi:GTPase SAR1 family protein